MSKQGISAGRGLRFLSRPRICQMTMREPEKERGSKVIVLTTMVSPMKSAIHEMVLKIIRDIQLNS